MAKVVATVKPVFFKNPADLRSLGADSYTVRFTPRKRGS
jgi:hypothetical protein